MKKVMIALAIASTSVVGVSMVDNPEAEFNNIVNAVWNWGEQTYQEVASEKYNKVIGTILSAIVTTITWISIYIIMGLWKARNAKKELMIKAPEKGIAEKKEEKTSEWSITYCINSDKKEESQVIEQAKARLLYQQLRQDAIVLEGRIKWLPDEIKRAKVNLETKEKIAIAYKSDYLKATEDQQSAYAKHSLLCQELEKEQEEVKKIDAELERLKALI